MNLSEIFIRRPVMTTLVMLAILGAGAVGYRELPVSDLPNVDFPTLVVTAVLPGASPETMASSVATPLERQFSTISGLTAMTSSSFTGTTQITLQFELSRAIDAAAQDVQSAISTAQRTLPRDMPRPPSFAKVNPADQPILYIALTSPTLPLSRLSEYGETTMAQRISTVSGVAQVQVQGQQKYAVRIRLEPSALAARGIGIDEVVEAVAEGNVNLPAGTLQGTYRSYTLEANGQLTAAAQYRPLVVAYRDGRPVRLEDLGQVVDSVENDRVAAWFDDERSIVLSVQRQPGTNTVEVAAAVRRLLPEFARQLPASVEIHVVFDRSQSIRQSVADVQVTLLLALVLVVLVIFLFLRNLSATLIPALALPLSIVGTFAVMHALGYSLDNLSLMALTLSVGFVVDDAIVVLENIVRHMELGQSPQQAALVGAREIGFTIVSMTLSLAAVFIPVLFMGGILGRLFHEFAMTIGVAILISGFVSLSLTPMMCSRFLRPPSRQGHGRLYRWSERVFDGLLAGYARALDAVLDRPRATMGLLGLVFAATVWMFVSVPKSFLPNEDIGSILISTEGPEGISFAAMSAVQRQLAQLLGDHPAVAHFTSSVGARGNNAVTSNSGILFARLKPRAEREPAETVIRELRAKMAEVPGVRVYLQIPPPIRISGQLTKGQYQFSLQSGDTEALYAAGVALLARMKDLPGLIDVNSDLEIRNPQLLLDIDRERASSYGVSAAAIEGALYSAYGPRQISTIFAPDNQYQVLVETAARDQRDQTALDDLYVRSSTGQLVPLAALGSVRRGVGPLTVSHSGQLPAVTLSFNLDPDMPLSTAVEQVQRLAAEAVPAGISTRFQGTAQAFQSSSEGLGLLLLLAVLVIYLVLGILYESFIHPLTILSALPLAGFGALATLVLFRVDLSLYAFVGLIMLVGLVKKNGIMMVDFAIEARQRGAAPREAIREASLVRFRPITMTTMAALMGTLPIALGWGAGAESRRPLGLAVVGGLVFSQLLTLFVTPVFYVYMERLRQFRFKRQERAA